MYHVQAQYKLHNIHAGGSAAKERAYAISAIPGVAGGGGPPSELLLGTSAGRVLVWDLRKPTALWAVAGLPGKVLGVTASKCGTRVMASSNAGQARSICMWCSCCLLFLA